MADETKNYKFTVPKLDDTANIEELSKNLYKIDSLLAEMESHLSTVVGSWTLTPLVAGGNAALSVTLAEPFKADSWRLLANGEDISGSVGIGESFTTAPVIFQESGLQLVFEKSGTAIFTAELEAGEDGGGINMFWDKAVSGIISSVDFEEFMRVGDYDQDGDGVVDNAANAAKLGGNLPSYYAKQQDMEAKVDKVTGKGLSSNDYTDADKAALASKANDSEVVKKSTGLPYSLTLRMNSSTSTYKGTSVVSKTWYAPTTAGTAGQVLKSNGSGAPGWGEIDKAKVVITIAASDSSAKDKAEADYICDGTGDEAEINAAINSLPEYGGTIYLTVGTYTTLAPIMLNKNNVSLLGHADDEDKTAIVGDVEHGNFVHDNSNKFSEACIAINANNTLLCGLDIRGSIEPERSGNTTTNTVTGIFNYPSACNVKIINCSISNWYHGIYKYYGMPIWDWGDTVISGCVFTGKFAFDAINDSVGHTAVSDCIFNDVLFLYNNGPLIYVGYAENPVTVERNYSNSKCGFFKAYGCDNCVVSNNKIDVSNTGTSESDYDGYGIYICGRAYSQVSKDTREPNSTLVQGNTVSGMKYGIQVYCGGVSSEMTTSISYCTIIGNTICNCFDGIYLYGSSGLRSSYLKIIGNYITSNINKGIYCYVHSSVIANNCVEKNDVGMLILNSYNNISGNVVRENATASIDVSGSYNLCVGNNIYGMNYKNSGSTNTFANNKYN